MNPVPDPAPPEPSDWRTAHTVSEWLAMRSQATPQADAFRHETAPEVWTSISWADFAERVAMLRDGMAAAGLRRGDRLALILPASLQWELLHHAALALGVVVVGLDAHDLPERLIDMARQADIAVFAIAEAALWHRLQPGLSAAGAGPLLISVGEGFGPAAPGERRMTLESLMRGAPAQSQTSGPLPGDTATIIFTSGTTGAPKGIAYSNAQLCMAVDAIVEAFSFTGSTSRLLCWLPLSNLFQRVVNLAGLRQGAVTWILGDPRRVMDVVAVASPDVFVGVPRFYEKLMQGLDANIAAQPPLARRAAAWARGVGRRVSQLQQQAQPLPLTMRLQHRLADRWVLRRIRAVMGTRLRCMVTGSAPVPATLLAEFHALGWTVLEAYGLSENVLPMAMNRLDDYRLGTVGKPLPGNEIVVDPDGQLRVRGPGLFMGYLGQAPGESFDAEGFYATGDLGAFDADGFLRLTGRNNDLIKTSTGRRVAPAGVEALLRAVPGIDQAVLLGAGRKALVALCTLIEPLPSDAELSQLESGLRSAVAGIGEHERPAAVALLKRPFSIDRGELTPNLKLRRAAIESLHADVVESLYGQIAQSATRQLIVA